MQWYVKFRGKDGFGGIPKNTSAVEEGGESWKSERNRIGGGEVAKPVRWLCEKGCLIFQSAEFFLISCLAVAKSFAVLSLLQHVKLFFLLERRRHFFFIERFLWTCQYFYCHCIYNCVKRVEFNWRSKVWGSGGGGGGIKNSKFRASVLFQCSLSSMTTK